MRPNVASPAQLRIVPPMFSLPLNVPLIVLIADETVGWVQVACATPALDTAFQEPVTKIPSPAVAMPE